MSVSQIADGYVPSAISYQPSANHDMVYVGTWLVLATLAIILVLFGLGWYWAWTHGQFDDVEAPKYAMLEHERRDRDDHFRKRTTHD